MSEYLQGNISERIRDLRRKNNLTQEQLADMLGIHKATISRIENGDSVTDEIALSIAKHFGVSLDFLFGVTDDPEPVNFDLKALGLSTAAAKKLYTGEVDSDIVNLFIENGKFGDFCKLISLYYGDVNASAYTAANTIYDEISEIVGNIDSDAATDIEFLKASEYEADETRIQNMFLDILRDIKSGLDSNVEKTQKQTKEIVAGIEKSVGKQNIALRRINAEKLAVAVVEILENRYEITEDERENLIAAIKPLFGKNLKKK